MGVALGCVGLSFDDFCRLETVEFEHICRAWRDMAEGDDRRRWERARLMAAITIQPHVRKPVSPARLLQFPWERKTPAAPPVTRAEAADRLKSLIASRRASRQH